MSGIAKRLPLPSGVENGDRHAVEGGVGRLRNNHADDADIRVFGDPAGDEVAEPIAVLRTSSLKPPSPR